MEVTLCTLWGKKIWEVVEGANPRHDINGRDGIVIPSGELYACIMIQCFHMNLS